MTVAKLQHEDRFLMRQLIRPMVNLYKVYTVGPDLKSPHALVAFVRQKRLAFKEQIRVFSDEEQTDEVFRIKARRVMEIGGRYDVTRPDGTPIGVLEKRFRQSLIRSTWGVLNAEGNEVMTAQEKNAAVAILRRVKEVFPYADMIPLPYHFSFTSEGREIGGLHRIISLRDQYLLDLTGDPGRSVDRSLAIALAIALDALQGR